jgi:hypothetical protein
MTEVISMRGPLNPEQLRLARINIAMLKGQDRQAQAKRLRKGLPPLPVRLLRAPESLLPE